jgi:hypothetical protein
MHVRETPVVFADEMVVSASVLWWKDDSHRVVLTDDQPVNTHANDSLKPRINTDGPGLLMTNSTVGIPLEVTIGG